jgi:hypothetical protein
MCWERHHERTTFLIATAVNCLGEECYRIATEIHGSNAFIIHLVDVDGSVVQARLLSARTEMTKARSILSFDAMWLFCKAEWWKDVRTTSPLPVFPLLALRDAAADPVAIILKLLNESTSDLRWTSQHLAY